MEQMFKVGEVARIKKGLKTKASVDGLYITEKMENEFGDTVTIKRVFENGECGHSYQVHENKWFWSDGMLEKIEENKESELLHKDEVELRDGRKCIVVGEVLIAIDNAISVSRKESYERNYRNKFSYDYDIMKIKRNGEIVFERRYEIDWSKVEVDTPIIVNGGVHRHFAKYENEEVYAWCDGCTSFTSIDKEMFRCNRAEIYKGDK